MLKLTRLSGPVFALNPDLIERAEATPDTVVTLVNGSKYVVRESFDELIELIHEYRTSLVTAAHAAAGMTPSSALHHTPAHRASARRDTGTAPSNSTTGQVVVLRPEDE